MHLAPQNHGSCSAPKTPLLHRRRRDLGTTHRGHCHHLAMLVAGPTDDALNTPPRHDHLACHARTSSVVRRRVAGLLHSHAPQTITGIPHTWFNTLEGNTSDAFCRHLRFESASSINAIILDDLRP